MTKTTRRGFFGMLACLAAWRPGLRPRSLRATYYQIDKVSDSKAWRAHDYQGTWVWIEHKDQL